MEQNNFTTGLRVFKPHENAPDFIKAQLVINVNEFLPYLEENAAGDGTVRIDIKESRGGKWYAQKNTYKPQVETPQDNPMEDSPF